MGVIGVILGIVAVYGLLMISGFHKVREGYVGMYKRFGVLQPQLTEPGIHFRIPYYQEFIEMNLLLQTDIVTNIPCGTSKGILVYFDKVEVVNRLKKQYVYETVFNYTENYDKFWITDKIHHQINQFCSKHTLQEVYIDIFDKLDEQLMKSLNKDLAIWAPGIQLLSVRLTKPNIPESIRLNFEEMQKTKVNFAITVQRQNVKVEEQMTLQKQQLIKYQSKKEVKQIEFDRAVQQKINQKKIAQIQAEMLFEKTKTEIETEFLSAFAEAELYESIYTDKYLSYLAKQAFSSNVTLNIGKYIPNVSVKV